MHLKFNNLQPYARTKIEGQTKATKWTQSLVDLSIQVINILKIELVEKIKHRKIKFNSKSFCNKV
jgi:hypothetical protein